jgi:biopolymer transport protein ExbD
MAMNIGGGSGPGGEPEVMMEINTTPLIDVMLVLLVMLIITIPIQLHSVDLNMPHGNPPPAVREPEVVRIDVDFDGTILWNGEVVADRPSLELKMTEAAAKADQPEIHVRPNKLVSYDHVAAVLASAQRLGLKKLGIIGNEQFLQ